ncbi:DMT family transporter [Pseudophaeobacter sp.]|uniref:DMT family transporter n=1 Tax=Pseudophaeobacter sp. TaxID=1971739 RepID=UPI003298AC3C
MVVAYTGVISSADGITKLLAGGYSAAQIYVLSGAAVALFSVLASSCQRQRKHKRTGQVPASGNSRSGVKEERWLWPWRTKCPRAMGLRSLSALLGAICFFYAFRLLPFAQVFLFIGLMPLLAGVMSGAILRERIGLWAWLALGLGFVGVLFLFPEGLYAVELGHLLALLGATCGTLSMILARYISRYDRHLLPQVFFPNLVLSLTMLPVLPFIWRSMPLQDLAWAFGYAALLFVARWLAVAALRLLPAYVVTPLMNLQFVWMVTIGALVFGEMPSQGTWLGGGIVIGSGLFLLWGQLLQNSAAPQIPAEAPPRPARMPA